MSSLSASSTRTGISTKASKIKQLELGKHLWITLKEFFENTTLHAYQYMVEPYRHFLEKFMWFCITILALGAAIYIVLSSWIDFSNSPTFTTLSSQQHPIWEVQFPGVAICNVNKISRAAAAAYVKEILIKHPSGNEELLFQRIRLLGRLYDFDIEGREDMLFLQDILDRFDTNISSGFYDVETNMRKLSPNCDDILVKCRWSGRVYNCSDIFEMRRATEGYCCMFNYIRPIDVSRQENWYRQVKYAQSVGHEQGLVVVLNASNEDYYYPLNNMEGFKVQIFNPNEYPDTSTGSVHAESVDIGDEVFMRIFATTLLSIDAVQAFTRKQRSCLFPEEFYDQFQGHYTFSECLLKCKIRSVVALCKCIPFQFPSKFGDSIPDDTIKCTLQQIPCLNRYRVKWMTYKPGDDVNTDGFEGELEDSLSCPDCLPLCRSISYAIQSSFSKISNLPERRPTTGLFEEILDITNLSVVRVYFPTSDSFLYKKDVVMTWYEILSNFGGMLGLCLGFSIISVVELIYFLTVRFYQNVFKSNQENENNAPPAIDPKKFAKQNNMFKPKKVINYKDIEISLSSHYDDKKFYFIK